MTLAKCIPSCSQITTKSGSEVSHFTYLNAVTCSCCRHTVDREAKAMYNRQGADRAALHLQAQCLMDAVPDACPCLYCRISAAAALQHPYFHDIQSILRNPPQLL